MVQKFAKYLALKFVYYGECSEEDVDIYIYALEAVIAPLLNVVYGLIISLLFGRFLEGTIFIIAFMFLRRFIGGYHVKTHFKCILTFCSILTCFLIALSLFQNFNLIFIAISIVAIIAWIGILISTHIFENEKHKIEQKKRHKIRSISVSTMFVVVSYVFLLKDFINIAMALVFALFIIFCGLLCAFFHQKQELSTFYKE